MSSNGSSGQLIVNHETTDYDSWNLTIVTHDSLDHAVSDGLKLDGLHRITLGNQSLDVLLSSSKFRNNHDLPLLVVFSGALPSREGKKAPFFNGRGLASALGVPLLSISDPTLTLSNDILLGWYAGNIHTPRLPEKIAAILSAAAKRHSRKLLLVGGSGGGFSALSVLTHLECPAIGCVWNPQIILSKFNADAVATYISIALNASEHIPTDARLSRSEIQA